MVTSLRLAVVGRFVIRRLRGETKDGVAEESEPHCHAGEQQRDEHERVSLGRAPGVVPTFCCELIREPDWQSDPQPQRDADAPQ